MAVRHRVERAIDGVAGLAAWLVLPIALLLFLQWPLRDGIRAWSREANDLAQWLFALYVGFAVTHATRRGAHPAIDGLNRHLPPIARDWIARLGQAVCVLPWAGFVLIVGAPAIWQSVRQMEAFPDTFNPGYFLLKLGVWTLAVPMFAQGVLDLTRPRDR